MLSYPKQEFDRLSDEARRLDSGDTRGAEVALALRFHPKWGGRLDEGYAYIERWARGNAQGDSDVLYSRLHWFMADLHHEGHVLPQRTDCTRMLQGMKILHEKYPSKWNATRFAIFATDCRDQPAAAKYLAFSSKGIEPQVWPSGAGRTLEEELKRVVAFTGQSLEFKLASNDAAWGRSPPGAAPLLKSELPKTPVLGDGPPSFRYRFIPVDSGNPARPSYRPGAR